MNASRLELSILMPCLNEAETLVTCIEKAKSWISKSGAIAEVLVADNGSSDGSQALAREAGARVIEVPVKGYGAALFAGAEAAKGKFIIMGDSDDSYDFSDLDNFLFDLRAGSDLVMGNRFEGGISKDAMPWKNRYIGNPALSAIGRFLFNLPVRDFHCGMRGFSKDAFQRMDLRTTGMEFASEMVIKSRLLDMKITEVPTTLRKDGRSRPPHLKPWRDGWRHLRFMLTLSPTKLLLHPSIVIQLLLLGPFILFLFGPIQVSGVTFSYNTFVIVQAIMYLAFLASLIGLTLQSIAHMEKLAFNKPRLKSISSYFLDTFGLLGLFSLLGGAISGIAQASNWAALGFSTLGRWDDFLHINLALDFIVVGSTMVLFSFVFAFLKLHTRNR